jgi:hypothetical protein
LRDLVGVAEITGEEPRVVDAETLAVRCATTTVLITAAIAADVTPVARRSHQRSTFRIVSDMVGAGALQSRAMSSTGATETIAKRAHHPRDAAPDA